MPILTPHNFVLNSKKCRLVPLCFAIHSFKCTDIANNVLPEIQMEEDFPNKNEDKKMAILDMKVWTDTHDGCIMYEHYEKPMSSKKVKHLESELSASCKHSVHTQEVLLHLLNSSPKLDWT